MSQTIASSAPPPRQCPCTAAMVTFLVATRARTTAWNFINISSTLPGACAATSTPAENDLPSALSTTTEISERASISARACVNSSIIGISMTFRGALRRTMLAAEELISTASRANLDSIKAVAMLRSVNLFRCRLRIDSKIYCRLADFADAGQRIARTGFLGNPLLFIGNDFQQKLLVFRRRHVLFQVFFISAVIERLAGLRVELLRLPASNLTIELNVRSVQLRLPWL